MTRETSWKSSTPPPLLRPPLWAESRLATPPTTTSASRALAASSGRDFPRRPSAPCDLSTRPKLVPCVVEAGAPETVRRARGYEGPWAYDVSYDKKSGAEARKRLPVARIRRVVVGGEWQCHEDRDAYPSRVETEGSREVPRDAPDSRLRPRPFPTGSAVELRGPRGRVGVPTTVSSSPEDQAKYGRFNLTRGAARTPLVDVDPRYVHPYRSYPPGTSAACDVGEGGAVAKVPCTVQSRVRGDADGGGDLVYRVSAEAIDGEGERVLFLPRLRVQRFYRND
jgi:hypothetical protein